MLTSRSATGRSAEVRRTPVDHQRWPAGLALDRPGAPGRPGSMPSTRRSLSSSRCFINAQRRRALDRCRHACAGWVPWAGPVTPIATSSAAVGLQPHRAGLLPRGCPPGRPNPDDQLLMAESQPPAYGWRSGTGPPGEPTRTGWSPTTRASAAAGLLHDLCVDGGHRPDEHHQAMVVLDFSGQVERRSGRPARCGSPAARPRQTGRAWLPGAGHAPGGAHRRARPPPDRPPRWRTTAFHQPGLGGGRPGRPGRHRRAPGWCGHSTSACRAARSSTRSWPAPCATSPTWSA
jgi:hypothetical protein